VPSVEVPGAKDLQPLGGLLPSPALGELPSASASLRASAQEHSAACAKQTCIHTVKAEFNEILDDFMRQASATRTSSLV
jgi:hypothetical protein